MVTRRAFLRLGIAGSIVAAAGVGGDLVFFGSSPTVLPDFPHRPPGPRISGAFFSRSRNRTVGWTISYPPGTGPGDELPVALVLHGYGSDHRYAFSTLGLQVAQAQIVGRRLIAPIALASIDGGDAYWHPRSDGDDPISMLLDEYLPMLARRGLRTSVFGVLGWSMGGYGALLLGEIDKRAAVIAAASPAIWPSYAVARSVNATAFDSAAQWDRYDVLAHARDLDGTPVRVDCGLSDPFLPASHALAHVLRPADSVDLEPGAHDATFWAARGPAQLRFLAARLS